MNETLPAVEQCGNVADEDCSGLDCSQTIWARYIGSADGESADAVATDSSQNVYVAGTFGGSLALDALPAILSGGDGDVFVAKLDAEGKAIWSVGFGGTESQYVDNLKTDPSDNLFVAGRYHGHMTAGATTLDEGATYSSYLAKISSSGAIEWLVHVSSDDQTVRAAMSANSQGSPAVATGYAVAPPGETDSTGATVAMFSTTGQETWRTAFTGSGDVTITDLDFDGSENLLAAGSFTGSLEAGGESILDDPQQRAFLARLNPSGEVTLLTRFGGAGTVSADAVAAHPSGDCIVAGSFEGTETFDGIPLTSAGGADIFVARVSPGGNVLWAKRFGGAGSQYVAALSVNSKGNIALAGAFSGQVSFGGDTFSGLGIGGMYVAMIDDTGDHVWSRGFDTDTLDVAFDMTVGPDDGVAVVGATYGNLDLGLGLITNSGAGDGLAMKIAP